MLVKTLGDAPKARDERDVAGREAEEQLEFYLSRAFGADRDVLVLSDVRLVDEENLFGDGRQTASQIDHLVLHRWGTFVIESKSCVTGVRVRSDAAGCDEWERGAGNGRWQGMPSPIQQARRQAEHLLLVLENDRLRLRQARSGLARVVTRICNGDDYGSFQRMPIQIVVAISDRGRMERAGFEPTMDPLRDAVLKADHVVDFVREEIARHRRGARPWSASTSAYGLWQLSSAELGRVGTYLAARHRPLRPVSAPVVAPAPATHAGSCKQCRSTRLIGRWGRYGYYWICADCGTNTSMPKACVDCGSRNARIHKCGPLYERRCPDCGVTREVWRDPQPSSNETD